MEKQRPITIRELYPEMNDAQLAEAERNLRRYVQIIWRIYERLKAEGQFDQVKGGAHQAWGDVKDAAKDLAARLHQNTVKGEVAAEREAAAERDALKRTDLP